MRKPNPPKNQIQEVLYYLLTRIKIDRRQMILSCGVLNLPEQIAKLKKRSVKISMTEFKTFNKFGLVVKVGEYSLVNKAEAAEQYIKMQESYDKRNV